jgi:CRP-like cAMP-binding protein
MCSDSGKWVLSTWADDVITPGTPNSRDSGIAMLNIDSEASPGQPKSPPSRGQLGTFPPPPTGDALEGGDGSRLDTTATDKFGGRRIDPEVWEVMSYRKSSFLKALSDWEFMRVVSRSKRKSFRGSTDRPFVIVQMKGKESQQNDEDAAKINDTMKRMNDKIARLRDSEGRERNAMAKARMQDEIVTCEETLACLDSDMHRSMYVVLSGELEVILIEEEASVPSSRAGSRAGSRPKTREKVTTTTKLSVLKRGDAFGDLTLILGMDRDTTIRAITPVELAVIRYDMVQSLIVRNPEIENRLQAFVTAAKYKSKEVQTHYLSRAIPFDAAAYKKINAAMATLNSPLMKVLTGREIENLSKVVSIMRVPQGMELYRQDDGPDTGWGPFGSSAFIVLEGEVSVTITFEDGDEIVSENGEDGKASEVARVLGMGESVGEMNLVTGAARTSTAVAATSCMLVEITHERFAHVVHRDIREDLMTYLGQPKNGSVEARVLSQRSQHAMRRRKSTFLKQLSDIEIDFLASVAVTRVEDKHTWIVRQDDWGDSAFVVLRGQLRVMVAFAEGEEFREVGRLKGGDVFGEMTLLLDYPRSSTVEVISKQAMLVEIKRDAAGTRHNG